MPGEFGIVDLVNWEVVHSEPLGRNPKDWVREPGSSDDRQRDWLFKPVVIAANGHRQGEDWAEKIVAQPGTLVGVPCAEVELAVRGELRGSISRNVVPAGWNLVHDPGGPKLSLVEFAQRALSLAGRDAEQAVLDRLGDINRAQVEAVVGRIPELSDLAATFIVELLDLNRRRLLRDC